MPDFAEAIAEGDFEAADVIAGESFAALTPQARFERHLREFGERWADGNERGARRAAILAAVVFGLWIEAPA